MNNYTLNQTADNLWPDKWRAFLRYGTALRLALILTVFCGFVASGKTIFQEIGANQKLSIHTNALIKSRIVSDTNWRHKITRWNWGIHICPDSEGVHKMNAVSLLNNSGL